MLVLTITPGMAIYAGDVRIELHSIKGANAVRLAFEAPDDVRIVRSDARNKEARDRERDGGSEHRC